MATQPANKLRRTLIVVGSLALCVAGLIYLNILPPDDITSINEKTAGDLLGVFSTIMTVYVLGSVAGPVGGKIADSMKNKNKDEIS